MEARRVLSLIPTCNFIQSSLDTYFEALKDLFFQLFSSCFKCDLGISILLVHCIHMSLPLPPPSASPMETSLLRHSLPPLLNPTVLISLLNPEGYLSSLRIA
ncbi:hypothetical protein WN944_025903 [Citrus x changshan-huyou]|uniref:Uncharacterized protein n=1 Tax=Citrus x changshan-huyou TaxID=2935761 RepID=A0AAP0LS24_9ROSI